ncbi:hypothetical protein C8F01DRAFT_1334653 [Mycena amicta]|nr:hypothetical protein C8F01DRAFT_1334653 [Mycena amicta]
MPRLLPRLIKLPLTGDFIPPQKKYRAAHKPVPPLPPIDPDRSVLLAPGNPVTNSRDYVHHKSRPPVFRLRRQQKNPTHLDALREMTAQERDWWSNPFLRMLTTPARQCVLSQRLLPSDLMIRLALMRPPPSIPTSRKLGRLIMPDGILHPAFKARRSGRARYVICSRQAIVAFHQRPKLSMALGGATPPRLMEQISHQLRLRVLQEVFLLAKALRINSDASLSHPPIIRRLRRMEWTQLRESGILPYPGALAVVVLPPVNRDPETKKREYTHDALSPLPPAETKSRPPPKRAIPPLCVLHPTAASDSPLHDGPLPSFFQPVRPPHAAVERIPLFNGVTLFPNRVQRAKLYELFTEMLGIEADWRCHSGGAGEHPALKKGDSKGSHAFLIYGSDEVDVGTLGIALWRVRMWESDIPDERI